MARKSFQLSLQQEFTKQHLQEEEDKKYKTITVRLSGKEYRLLDSYIKFLSKKENTRIKMSEFIRALISVVVTDYYHEEE